MTTMLWKGFQRPKRLEFERETLTDRFGRFYAQPFERGFGTTVGNAMRRVLPPREFAAWLLAFMPRMPLQAERVTDPTDGQLAHLDGLNLSRAWMLDGIVSALPKDDARRAAWMNSAEAHRKAGLAAVTGEHYEGGHWLGSFAVYLTTARGLPHTVRAARQ